MTDRLRLALRAFIREKLCGRLLNFDCRLTGRGEEPILLEARVALQMEREVGWMISSDISFSQSLSPHLVMRGMSSRISYRNQCLQRAGGNGTWQNTRSMQWESRNAQCKQLGYRHVTTSALKLLRVFAFVQSRPWPLLPIHFRRRVARSCSCCRL